MSEKRRKGFPTPVSDLAGAVLDPVLRRRAGMTVALLQSWEEIVGPRTASRSRPERIAWPKRMSDDDPFQPATLIVACEALAALHIQHETSEIVARINAFLGFAAVGRIRIVQKPVAAVPSRKPRAPMPLTPAQSSQVARAVSGIEDEGLRESLARLGAGVLGSRR